MPEPIPAWELEAIMTIYKEERAKGKTKTQAFTKAAEIVGRPPKTVYAVIMRMTPTVGVAQDFIKAKALKLAKRMVAKANVTETIDILSRSNIGVLAPKQEHQGGGGFFLSVTTESCGAVKIGVQTGAIQEQIANEGGVRGRLGAGNEGQSEGLGSRDPQYQGAPEQGEQTEGGEGDEGLQIIDVHPQIQRAVGKSLGFQEALARAQAKIEDAKARDVRVRHKSPRPSRKKAHNDRKRAERAEKQVDNAQN